MSRAALDRMIPVTPPVVNRVINPITHRVITVFFRFKDPKRLASHLKILIPVGIPITIVAHVKYERLSMSIPIVYMWWAHTIQPRIPILLIAKIILCFPKICFLPLINSVDIEMMPKAGRIRMYTSGCPKNQKSDSKRRGSPPPQGSK